MKWYQTNNCALVLLLTTISPVLAQSSSINLDRRLLEEDPRAYCSPVLGQTIVNGVIVTVPMGHNCDGWLNYQIQRKTTEENLKFRREELETNSKLQLYLNTRPTW